MNKYLVFCVIFLCAVSFDLSRNTCQSQASESKTNHKVGNKYDSFYQSAKEMTIHNYYNTNYNDIFSKENIFHGQAESFKEMSDEINTQLKRYKGQLEDEWNFDDKILKAVFIMNVVNNMFALGEEGGMASVFSNKNITNGNLSNTSNYPALQCATVNDYFASDFGDCNDYAMMMYVLLNIAGIENRQVGPQDHIYNEVKVNNKYYIFDALYLFFTQMDNEKFLHQSPGEKAVYNTFYLDGSNPLSEGFRKKRGAMKIYYLLSRGRTSHFTSKDYSHWNRFNRYTNNNKICQPSMNIQSEK